MIPAIQSRPPLLTSTNPIALLPLSKLAQRPDALLAKPAVIVSLGTTPAEALTYSAAGRIGSQLPAPDYPMGSATSPPVFVEKRTLPSATANVSASAATTNSDVMTTRDSLLEANVLSSNMLVSLSAQSLATLTTNPAYAIAVAGFHTSMANSRLDLALAAARPSPAKNIGPVTAISAIAPIAHTMGGR